MPIDAHPPNPHAAFRLDICTSCRVGDHRKCGPLWDRRRRRAAYCECPGWDTAARTGGLVLLPCLPLRGAR